MFGVDRQKSVVVAAVVTSADIEARASLLPLPSPGFTIVLHQLTVHLLLYCLGTTLPARSIASERLSSGTLSRRRARNQRHTRPVRSTIALPTDLPSSAPRSSRCPYTTRLLHRSTSRRLCAYRCTLSAVSLVGEPGHSRLEPGSGACQRSKGSALAIRLDEYDGRIHIGF